MDLLERDLAFRELERAMVNATRGEGRVALVSGEAGIGKTAVVEQFARRNRATIRILWGSCDPLSTPRPLGPLHDIATQTRSDLAGLLASGADLTTIFPVALAELHSRAVIAVFEDDHWADEATLDLLRFLGRRIARTAAVLVLTYRDDELGRHGHPLRTLLGDLASWSAYRSLRSAQPRFARSWAIGPWTRSRCIVKLAAIRSLSRRCCRAPARACR